MLKKYTL